jgi:hypothetical protein
MMAYIIVTRSSEVLVSGLPQDCPAEMGDRLAQVLEKPGKVRGHS